MFPRIHCVQIFSLRVPHLVWGSQQTGNKTFTIPKHLSVESEETNRDGIAPFGDVDEEHTHNPGLLGVDTKTSGSRGAVSGL